MKRTASIFALTLLLICMLPIVLDTSLVQAEAGGTGKFLTIEILGEGYVTATKIQSGETWNFYPTDPLPPMTEKVGAGTVLLCAYAVEGWEFSHWEGDITGTLSSTEYKTEKYGYVIAVFVQKIFTIYASAVGNGAISPSGAVPVEYDTSQTFLFDPDGGHHISAILIDGAYLGSYAESYTFEHVTADHTIEVHFSADGTATVPAGSGVTGFLDPRVFLTFSSTDGGTATGEPEYYAGWGATAWDIIVTFGFSEATVTLVYDDTGLILTEEEALRLIRCESIEAFRSDVNFDLVVDGTDVSIVANAVKKGIWYDPLLDINNDGFVDEFDIHTVNANKGAFLEDITGGRDTDLNTIWGSTGGFSIFGVHRYG